MNWGYKILFVYLIFVSGIIFLVFKSSIQNQDLVTKDYYEQELKFQDRIDETERTNALSDAVKYEVSNDQLTIKFPDEMKGSDLTAHVLLYCAADENKDMQQDLSTKNGRIHLSLLPANKGLYELKIRWTANNTSYYYEHKLFLQ